MPIRTEQLLLYPDDWAAISDRIRFERAGGRCECDGLCGKPLDHLDSDGRCRNRHGLPRWNHVNDGQCVVRLTTAHLDHDPSNCADGNLLAACESCHLAYDQAHHLHTRSERRYAEMGLVPLFELDDLIA